MKDEKSMYDLHPEIFKGDEYNIWCSVCDKKLDIRETHKFYPIGSGVCCSKHSDKTIRKHLISSYKESIVQINKKIDDLEEIK